MAYSNITLTTQTGLSFITGEFIQLIHDSNNYMFGQIVSYNPSTGSLTFTPTRVVGTGTYSTWEVIASGAAGNDGTSGTSGINGTSGTSGATGTSGASGTSGTSGTDGTSGSSGIDGTSGTSGLTGTSGTSGVNGTSGVSGTSGTSGTDGAAGSSGTAGTSGTSGINGTNGTSGTSGVNGTSGITPDPNARTETTFTATAGQTTFTVSYTVGQVDVYYNGSKLAPAEFTATTGTSIVLATACQAGDIVDVLANITGGGVGGGGSAGNVAYFSSTNVIAGSNNLAWDNSSQYFTIGAPPTALANLHVYNPSAAASMLLQTNSSTDYGEIAVRNNASTATSYFRQYSTAATGSDFGISRAGLALFFSNYATNFAIGTRNGGDLILGTADTERARITTSGDFGVGTSSPLSYTSYKTLQVSNTAGALMIVESTAGSILGQLVADNGYSGGASVVLGARSNHPIVFTTNNTNRLTISTTGAATFSSSVTAAGTIQTTNGNGLFTRTQVDLTLNSTSTSQYGRLIFQENAVDKGVVEYINSAFGGFRANKLELANAGGITFITQGNFTSPDMYITSGGNVGIGTSSPTWKLDVSGTGNDIGRLKGTGYANLRIESTSSSSDAQIEFITASNSGNSWSIGKRDDSISGTASGSLWVYNSATSTTSLWIHPSTNAATFSNSITAKTSGDYRQATLGTLTGAALFITNTSYAGYGLLVGNSYSYGDAWMQVGRVDGSAVAYNLLLQPSGGNVGIGTSIPTGKLDVVGDVRASGTSATLYFMNRPSSNYFAWYGSTNILLNNSDIGNIASIAYNTGAYTALSDINKKKDFEDSTIGLNEILGLKPTLFRMKDEEDTEKHLGFIAQEVKEYIPQAYVEQGEFIGLQDRPIIAALVKAIQEQQKQIENQQQQINSLINR